MTVLILGASGMLGHQMWRGFRKRFDTHVTLRGSLAPFAPLHLFEPERTIPNVSAEDFDSVMAAFTKVRPEAVINCIGVIKQQPLAKDPIAALTVNSVFPHRLARLCQASGCRLIHVSTDCVFSGRKGNYEETDLPDAEDLYGQSKRWGEVSGPGCLTLRTSIIGHELGTRHGLLEWFLARQGQSVRGFRRAIFSGLTTLALTELIARVLTEHRGLEGVWQVAAAPINKFDLLTLIRSVYRLGVTIEPESATVCDRSLCDRKFREATGWSAAPWRTMLEAMRLDHYDWAQPLAVPA